MSRLTMQEVIDHCEKTAKRIENNVKYCREWLKAEQRPLESKNYLEHKQTAEWLKELQRYKDLEEQGRLIELPCKVGDTVWSCWIDGEESGVASSKPINEQECILVKDLWGKRVFHTKAEAEAKLEELKGE